VRPLRSRSCSRYTTNSILGRLRRSRSRRGAGLLSCRAPFQSSLRSSVQPGSPRRTPWLPPHRMHSGAHLRPLQRLASSLGSTSTPGRSREQKEPLKGFGGAGDWGDWGFLVGCSRKAGFQRTWPLLCCGQGHIMVILRQCLALRCGLCI
jgi:hypothetical protein